MVYCQCQAFEQHGITGMLDRRRFGLATGAPRAHDARVVEAIMSVTARQTRKSTGTKLRAIWLVLRELSGMLIARPVVHVGLQLMRRIWSISAPSSDRGDAVLECSYRELGESGAKLCIAEHVVLAVARQ